MRIIENNPFRVLGIISNSSAVVIGIVKADKKIEIEEINFINQLIINLRVPSEIIKSRFGNWDSLSDELYDDKSD